MLSKEYLTCPKCGDEIEDADAMELHEEVCIGEEEVSSKTLLDLLKNRPKGATNQLSLGEFEGKVDEWFEGFKKAVEGLVAELQKRRDKADNDMKDACSFNVQFYSGMKYAFNDVLAKLGIAPWGKEQKKEKK